jgi:hypothetical protein
MGPGAAVMGYVSKSCDFPKKEILIVDISDQKTIFSNFFFGIAFSGNFDVVSKQST